MGYTLFSMKRAVTTALTSLALCASAGDALVEGFLAPPREACPHTWWHWMNGNVSKAGITADLEAMKAVGIGGVQVFDTGLAIPAGPVAFDTPAWYEHLAFAAQEAERLGLSFGVANCSGWTSSGGPWITPELSMKVVVHTTTQLTGPQCVSLTLPRETQDHGFYRDIAVVAFPTPKEEVTIPDLARRVFRVRGDEAGPYTFAALEPRAFPPQACIPLDAVRDVSDGLKPDGSFAWEVPAGSWTVLRVGFAANGRQNRPPSPRGAGLECDKLSAKAMDVHFDAYVGKVLKALQGIASFDNVLLDSYEVQGQNWTDGFEEAFAARMGYSILPWLPAIAGYPIDSTEETERFFADFRRAIADLFNANYAGRLAERCHEHGLKLALEPYGNCPTDDLGYALHADIPMGEFWVKRGDGLSMATRWGHRLTGNGRTVASAAHVWGRRIVGAEAFTSWPTTTSGKWQAHPSLLKAQGDRVWADGVNRFYYHRFVHQPWAETRYPGMTMAFYGTHFDRTQTWWSNGFAAFNAYVTRSQYLLQQGDPVVDVIFDVGSAAPDFGTAGDVPRGWKADHCTSAAFAEFQRTDAGWLSPGGTRYRLAAKPGEDIVARLRDAGIGPDFQCADEAVSWTHRRAGTDEIYFVARSGETATTIPCRFRDGRGKASAELWDPDKATIRRVTARAADEGVRVDIPLDPNGSVFVVFRDRPTAGATVEPTLETASERTLAGPWRVGFREPGATTNTVETTFDALIDWTSHGDTRIRHFSGTAEYVAEMALDSGERKDRRLVLDLGEVWDIAEVTVNGKTFPVLWRPPYRVDITSAIGKANPAVSLSIRITNRWPNRLIAEGRKDDGLKWDANNKWHLPIVREIPKRVDGLFTTCRFYRGDEPLLPSGLLGPVIIRSLEVAP